MGRLSCTASLSALCVSWLLPSYFCLPLRLSTRAMIDASGYVSLHVLQENTPSCLYFPEDDHELLHLGCFLDGS